ncbi:5'-methylthioadenosine/S-adenosylhomocysteine nucleosidase [Tianweitania aestuarii]|uniref:5'-methylthioadenosine/S-adenosylhomocysteine nucleosidase n=1 Tax=Tianweitania aestuarii TaxID=2814886 RepID=UPI003D64A3E3
MHAVGAKRLLFVMAAPAEYGPFLQSRFKPLMTGIGPVEAAIALSTALAQLQQGETLPDLIISLGSAGSRVLEQTKVYQATSVSYRDMDASALGFPPGVTPLLDLPAILPLPIHIPEIATATLSTGANIVSGQAYDRIEAEMVDMETFALLRVAMRYQIPLIALRGISDGAAELTHVDDWTAYLHIVDENLAYAVDRLEHSLNSGIIAL